jgi:hypothetical protein
MDISDKLVRRMQLKTLRQFAQLMEQNCHVRPDIRAELKRIVDTHGVGSVEYDNYLKSIASFDGTGEGS